MFKPLNYINTTTVVFSWQAIIFRMFFVAARNGHAPAMLNTVHLKRNTPAGSVMALVCSVVCIWKHSNKNTCSQEWIGLEPLPFCKSIRIRELQGVLSAGALLLWSDVGPLLTSTSYLSNLHDTVTVSTLLYFRWRLARSPSGASTFANNAAPDGHQSGQQEGCAHTSRVPLLLAVPLLVLAFQFVVQLGAPFHESLKEPGTFARYTRMNTARRCCYPRPMKSCVRVFSVL